MQDRHDPVAMSLSLLAMFALWEGVAFVLSDPTLLPGPIEVASIIMDEAASGRLWRHLWPTVLRVIAAFSLAMAVGTALGLLLGMSKRADRWLDPWVVVFLNLPALVVIVLCYLWIGLNEMAAIIAVAVNKTALVLVTVREGARALDPQLHQMARVFGMSRWAEMRHVTLPQLAPHFSSAARNGLAIIWKLVLVVEFLGRSNGIGFQIHLYFQLFEIGHVMAYAMTFVLLMLVVEVILIQPVERGVRAWRQSEV
ncbi:MAG: ABC transporter permease [Rhodobacteraceae bacterium]|nr:ABC transporter permease [Paracoccaceae bacterium]